MHSLILHVKSKSHPLWQVHAQSHLTRHIKIPPPLASICTVSSYTSYQNPTPSGKYMHSLILHVISKSHPLWQVHARSHLTRHIKIPPPLASTCKITSYGSYQNPTPSGKYMHSLILHVISKSHPLWQVHAQSHLTGHIKIPPPLASHIKIPPPLARHARSHLTRHIKIPPPLASTCKVTSYTSYQNPTPVASACTVSSYTFTDLGLRSIVYEPCFTSHGLRIMVYEPWFTSHGLRSIVYEPWFTSHGLRSIVYELQASDKVVPVFGKNRCALGKCVSQKSCL